MNPYVQHYALSSYALTCALLIRPEGSAGPSDALPPRVEPRGVRAHSTLDGSSESATRHATRHATRDEGAAQRTSSRGVGEPVRADPIDCPANRMLRSKQKGAMY